MELYKVSGDSLSEKLTRGKREVLQRTLHARKSEAYSIKVSGKICVAAHQSS